MLVRTYKLKRTKILGWCFTIPFLILSSPFLLLWGLGEAGEYISELLLGLRDKCTYYVADKLRFDDVANNQYEINPDKFKENWY